MSLEAGIISYYQDEWITLFAYSVPKGGIVIDCFAGSGTTLAVARQLGRRAIGIEMREEQCQAIVIGWPRASS